MTYNHRDDKNDNRIFTVCHNGELMPHLKWALETLSLEFNHDDAVSEFVFDPQMIGGAVSELLAASGFTYK